MACCCFTQMRDEGERENEKISDTVSVHTTDRRSLPCVQEEEEQQHVRFSPNTISRTCSNTLQINTETLYEDISVSLNPVKLKFRGSMSDDSFEELKHAIIEVFTEYSNKIVQEITSQLKDIETLMGTIQSLNDEKKRLIERNNELEYNYSMVITGNAY